MLGQKPCLAETMMSLVPTGRRWPRSLWPFSLRYNNRPDFSLTGLLFIHNIIYYCAFRERLSMSIFQDLSDAPSAFGLPEVLHPDIYAELRALAAKNMRSHRRNQTLQTTVLVHEAWLRLSRQGHKWESRRHFFATASLAMRQIIIDHARRKKRNHREGANGLIASYPMNTLAAPDQPDIILLIDEGITELEKVHPELAQVVVDRFFGGLTIPEIAEALNISERSVARHWAMAKVWLQKWVEENPRSIQNIVA
jgi:RNA polymerase sigma factor (TIGR02999 family)